MKPILLGLLVIVCIACLTITPSTGHRSFEVTSKTQSIKDFATDITIADIKYKDWPALRSLLEGIGKGYLMLEEFEILEQDKIEFDAGKTVIYDLSKPVSVPFLGKGGNGKNGLVSFLVRLLVGKEQIIFYLSRDETEAELKEDWAAEIANKIFQNEPVNGRKQKFGVTKQEFITAVSKVIDLNNVDGHKIVAAIKVKDRKAFNEQDVLNTIQARKDRETISKIIFDQFTSLLDTVENELGVKVIRQPDPTDASAIQKYYEDLKYLATFPKKRFLGDDLAGKGRTGDGIKDKMLSPLAFLNLYSKQGVQGTKPLVWTADVQSFRSNTSLPVDAEMYKKEHWEKEKLITDSVFPVIPNRTTVIGTFTGDEKEDDFPDHKYSICQTGQLFSFIEDKTQAAPKTVTGLQNYRYAVPRAKNEKGWQDIYTKEKFDAFKKAILLEDGNISVMIGEVVNGQVILDKEKTLPSRGQ